MAKAPRIGEATTPNFGWVKPTVGASDDVWGGYINADLDGIDTTVKSVSNAIPLASSTAPLMNGSAAAGTGTTWARADHVHPSERVYVRNFGAVGDGVADDTSAIQAAINSLPNDGGIILFSPGKNYKITSGLTIGNGTPSALSTKQGVILRGDGIPNTGTGYAGPLGPRLTWAGGATPMITIKGPLQGWGVQNLILDGAGISGSYGLTVGSAAFGDCSNLTVTNFFVGIYSTSNPLGGYAGISNVDALHNNWTNISVYAQAVAGAKGIFLDGDHAGSSDTDYNIFTNVQIGGGSANNFGLYIGVADANVFNGLHIGGLAAGVGIQFDHTFHPTFPLANQFYNYEVLAGTPFAISGTPNAFQQKSPNRFYGLLSSNNAVAPSVVGSEAIEGAWITFAPALSWAGAATFTVNSARYKTIGKTTYVSLDFTVAASGTTANAITFALPKTPASGGALAGYNQTQALAQAAGVKSGNLTAVLVQAGKSSWVLNDWSSISGVYESQ